MCVCHVCQRWPPLQFVKHSTPRLQQFVSNFIHVLSWQCFNVLLNALLGFVTEFLKALLEMLPVNGLRICCDLGMTFAMFNSECQIQSGAHVPSV